MLKFCVEPVLRGGAPSNSEKREKQVREPKVEGDRKVGKVVYEATAGLRSHQKLELN